MSTITISDAKTRIQSKIHGGSINKVQDFYGLCLEAAGNVLLKIDPAETKRTAQVENALYDQQYEYTAPADLKQDRVIDLRVQANRVVSDNFTQTGGENFDLYKSGETFVVENNSGVKTLRISKALTAGTLLHSADSLTSNGTWTAGGNATNLAIDTFNKITGNASLKFDISASGSTAWIENSTFTAVDLSDLVNVGALFEWVSIPSTTIITSVTLRWGTDSSNYYHTTVTTGVANTSFVNGWNLLRHDWSSATTVGTPTNTSIGYVRVTFNYNGSATTACRVDNIIAKLGSIYNVVYYSNFLFRTAAGVWIEKPTLDTDLINLDVTSINLFYYELGELVAQEMQGEDSTVDVDYWTKKKTETWDTYMRANKSEAQKRRNSYYSMPRRSRGG